MRDNNVVKKCDNCGKTYLNEAWYFVHIAACKRKKKQHHTWEEMTPRYDEWGEM